MLYFDKTMDKMQLGCHNNNNMTKIGTKIGETQITQETGAGDN